MPFPYVPTEVSAHKLQQILNEKDRDSILAYYEKDDQEGFQKKEELTEEDNIRLREIF